MLQVSKKLQERMLEKRQDEWLEDQMNIFRSAYPEACGALEDDALAARLEGLFAQAQDKGIQLNANHQRFAHLACTVDDDDFVVSQEWAATVFAWDADENMKLSACEQHLAGRADTCSDTDSTKV